VPVDIDVGVGFGSEINHVIRMTEVTAPSTLSMLLTLSIIITVQVNGMLFSFFETAHRRIQNRRGKKAKRKKKKKTATEERPTAVIVDRIANVQYQLPHLRMSCVSVHLIYSPATRFRPSPGTVCNNFRQTQPGPTGVEFGQGL